MTQAGKIALITGASRGIGAAIACRLSKDGYTIWCNYKSNDDAANELKANIEKSGGFCELLKFDVSDEASVGAVLGEKIKEKVPDVLVNNAGITKDTLMMWMTSEDWKTVTDTTLLGFFNVTKAVLFEMLKRRSGRIINIASTAGQSGLGGQVNYSAAKAGLIGATKSLAKEVAKRGIFVNAVAPGFIDTDMLKGLPLEEIKKNVPLGTIGKPEDVAGVVSFLCSPDAQYIVGEVISVNGGLYM
jgi:3-oxoacyl-[acyl-carrier protein] reductase